MADLLSNIEHIINEIDNPSLVDESGNTYERSEVELLECGLYAVDDFKTYYEGEYEDTTEGWLLVDSNRLIDSTKEADIRDKDYSLVVIGKSGDMINLSDMSGYDYLKDCLDINYIISQDRQYLGAEITACWGGPNIYINTRSGTVTGYWGSEKIERSYNDVIGLDDACEELWNIT